MFVVGPSSSLNASEERGEVADDTFIYTEDEKISLCLQHCHRLPPYKNGVLFGPLNNTEEMVSIVESVLSDHPLK